MPKISPLVTLFLAIAAMNVGLFGWQRAGMAALETRIEARIAALEIRIEERFTALETRIEERLVRIEAGQAELRERMARIEGTVAGALARPDRLAQAPADEAEAAN